MAAGRRVRGRESRQPRRRKHWLVAARWLRSSTEAATWDTAFICEPGAHRHRPQQSKTANTDTNMCTQTHTGLIPHIYIWHIIADSVLLWPRQKLYSQTYYTNRFSEQESNRIKTTWKADGLLVKGPDMTVTLGYNLHTRHKFECFGNKRQIRTLLATPPPKSSVS